jgi:hypothetical protein
VWEIAGDGLRFPKVRGFARVQEVGGLEGSRGSGRAAVGGAGRRAGRRGAVGGG